MPVLSHPDCVVVVESVVDFEVNSCIAVEPLNTVSELVVDVAVAGAQVYVCVQTALPGQPVPYN